jgi:hypothetical protein
MASARLVRRAKMILLSADGVSNTAIATHFATSMALVSLNPLTRA